MEQDLTVADRLSDRIVSLVNCEIETMRATGQYDAMQLFIGSLLALRSLINTMPVARPDTLIELERSVDNCLRDLRIMGPITRYRWMVAFERTVRGALTEHGIELKGAANGPGQDR